MRSPLRRMGLLRHQAGLSLVEILVALAVGLVLLAGIYRVFIGSTDTYQTNEALARVQENSRFATEFLGREIRQSGYMGCVSNASKFTNVLNDPTAFSNNFGVAVEGFEATGTGSWSPALPASISSPLGGSDVLILRGIDGNSTVEMTDSMPDTSAVLKVTNQSPPAFVEGDIVLVSDCIAAAAFQVSHYQIGGAKGELIHNTGLGVPGNATKNLDHSYEAGATIAKAAMTAFYVRTSPDGEPSLYRRSLAPLKDPEEIVSGVRSMQITYGEDQNGDRAVDRYITANNVTNWNRILSVRIGLLLQSPSQIARGDIDTRTYNVNGQEIGPLNDRRLRLLSTATIGLRNRLP